jgi:hypothetical protein
MMKTRSIQTLRGTSQTLRGASQSLRGASQTLRGASAMVSLAVSVVLITALGCTKTVDDATLTTNVKAALSGDAAISQQPVQVAVQQGVVTLSGNVSDDTASSVAAQDAARVTGVKQVVNSLTVAGIAVAPTITQPSAPTEPRPTTPQERTAIARHEFLPPPVENAPPQPAYRNVSVPQGTTIPMRINQTLDSETTPSGARFDGVVVREVVADGLVVVPAGSAVSGHVVEAKDAAHFKGSSLLVLSLDTVRIHGNVVPVATTPYEVAGKGRGENTAEKVGGGAAVGAILGGIFGGGKGAAIGAGAGAGGGAIVQGATRGQQVTIPSETLLRFQLTQPFTVRTAEVPSEDGGR